MAPALSCSAMSRIVLLIGLVFGIACSTRQVPAPPAPKDASNAAYEPRAERVDPAEELKLSLPRADPREPRIGAAIKQLLERAHLKPHPIDDSIAAQAFTMYIDHLDPGKLVLLKPQVDVLARDANLMDDQLRLGDFRLARTGAALVARERQKVAAYVAELLAAP